MIDRDAQTALDTALTDLREALTRPIKIVGRPRAPVGADRHQRLSYELSADGWLTPTAVGDIVSTVEPSERYLKAIDLDLEDSGAIRAFANEYGAMGVWHYNGEAFRGWPAASLIVPTSPRPHLPEALALASFMGVRTQSPNWSETLDEFRFAVRCLRDLVALWRVHSGQLPATEFRLEQLRSNRLEVMVRSDPDEAMRSTAIALSKLLTPALTRFHPRLELEIAGEANPGLELASSGELPNQLIVGLSVSLYAQCCAELFGHIVESAPYRVCANCHRLFVRQEGRSKHGQLRKEGVLYCHARCARLKNQRAWRARERLKRTGGARSGLPPREEQR